MQIFTIVLTHDSQSSIITCLDSLKAQKVARILVIDSASQDETVRIVQEKYPDVNLITSSINLGYARGNNLGIKRALTQNDDYILIVNPDTKLLPKCLDRLTDASKSINNQGIFGPKILNSDRLIWSSGGELDPYRYSAILTDHHQTNKDGDKQHESVFISGTCMFIPRKILEIHSNFYEPYFMYYEDVEFCLKLNQKGCPSIMVPGAQIIHFETAKHHSGSYANYYLARNHLLFVERNAPIGVKLRESLRIPKTIWEHYRKQDSLGLTGIKDYIFKKFGAYAG